MKVLDYQAAPLSGLLSASLGAERFSVAVVSAGGVMTGSMGLPGSDPLLFASAVVGVVDSGCVVLDPAGGVSGFVSPLGAGGGMTVCIC